jgi:hypothetical protein
MRRRARRGRRASGICGRVPEPRGPRAASARGRRTHSSPPRRRRGRAGRRAWRRSPSGSRPGARRRPAPAGPIGPGRPPPLGGSGTPRRSTRCLRVARLGRQGGPGFEKSGFRYLPVHAGSGPTAAPVGHDACARGAGPRRARVDLPGGLSLSGQERGIGRAPPSRGERDESGFSRGFQKSAAERLGRPGGPGFERIRSRNPRENPHSQSAKIWRRRVRFRAGRGRAYVWCGGGEGWRGLRMRARARPRPGSARMDSSVRARPAGPRARIRRPAKPPLTSILYPVLPSPPLPRPPRSPSSLRASHRGLAWARVCIIMLVY